MIEKQVPGKEGGGVGLDNPFFKMVGHYLYSNWPHLCFDPFHLWSGQISEFPVNFFNSVFFWCPAWPLNNLSSLFPFKQLVDEFIRIFRSYSWPKVFILWINEYFEVIDLSFVYSAQADIFTLNIPSYSSATCGDLSQNRVVTRFFYELLSSQTSNISWY